MKQAARYSRTGDVHVTGVEGCASADLTICRLRLHYKSVSVDVGQTQGGGDRIVLQCTFPQSGAESVAALIQHLLFTVIPLPCPMLYYAAGCVCLA